MGRTAEFNREEVIEQAMDVFWSKGYYASSMNDLKDAMGLQPGSIYAAFGSKHNLLLECLAQYSSIARVRFTEISSSSPTQREAFMKIYSFMIEQMMIEKICRGCLMTNILLELATHDNPGGEAARKYLKLNQDFFLVMLGKAKTNGEIQSNRSIEELAAFLMGIAFSLRVMGKAKAGKEALETIRDQALDQVFGG